MLQILKISAVSLLMPPTPTPPPPPPRFHIKCHTHGTRYESRSFYHDLCNRNPHFVGLHVDKRRHWQVSDQPGLDIRLCSVPWQVDRPGWKLGGLALYMILFREFYFLPFSVHAQTNVIDLTLCSVIIVVLKSYDRTFFSMMLSDKVGVI